MRNPAIRCFALGLGAISFLFMSASGALAHAHLTSSTPAADAVVAAPAVVTLHFTEALEARFSGFEITDAHGTRVNAPSVLDPHDNMTMTATPPTPLAAGAYHVSWHLVAHDGHRMRGEFAFTVH